MAHRQRHSGIKELDTSIHKKKRNKSVIKIRAPLNRKKSGFYVEIRSTKKNTKHETRNSKQYLMTKMALMCHPEPSKRFGLHDNDEILRFAQNDSKAVSFKDLNI